MLLLLGKITSRDSIPNEVGFQGSRPTPSFYGWGQKEGDGVAFPLQTKLWETCRVSLAPAGGFALSWYFFQMEKKLNNPSFWWKNARLFCFFNLYWRSHPIRIKLVPEQEFLLLNLLQKAALDMSGGLLGIPGIFVNRRCTNSAKDEFCKTSSSLLSSISSSTCWTRSQLFLKLGFLQAL